MARVRLDREGAKGHGLAYKKMFEHCSAEYSEFEVGKSLKVVVIDWSDTEVARLRGAIGEDLARKLLKGCKVHWNHSWQRVRDRVASSTDKTFEKAVFGKIASSIVTLPADPYAFRGHLQTTGSTATGGLRVTRLLDRDHEEIRGGANTGRIPASGHAHAHTPA